MNRFFSTKQKLLITPLAYLLLILQGACVRNYFETYPTEQNKTIYACYGLIEQKSSDYNVLKLYTDSTYSYFSASKNRPTDIVTPINKYVSFGSWHKFNNYLYLERSDIKVVTKKNFNNLTKIQLYVLEDSIYETYKNVEVKFYKKNECKSFYSDIDGCLRLPVSFTADFISIGFPGRDIPFFCGMDMTIYMSKQIEPENIWSLWEIKNGYLRHPTNHRLKLYDNYNHPKLKKIKSIE